MASLLNTLKTVLNLKVNDMHVINYETSTVTINQFNGNMSISH